MRHILEYIPESADTLYSSTYLSRLENYKSKNGYHALRDIRKCGITYNIRDLFPIVFDELKVRIPDKRWSRSNIFKQVFYIDDDGEHECLRGYCLGMANHLVTLCNVAISRMARSMSYKKTNSKVKCTCIVGNDDLGACFYPKCKEAKDLAEEYLNNEHEIHANLGNITNQKKSVVKDEGLFYENYTAKGWQAKESLVCNAIACAYLAPTIRVAKHYVSSQSDRFKSEWAFSELRRLAEYWGPEFFTIESELYITSEIGGWLQQTSWSLSTLLLDIDYLVPRFRDDMILHAYKACSRYYKAPKPEFKTQGYVNNHLYQGPAKHADPRVQMFSLVQDDILSFYKKLTSFQRNFKSRIENSNVKGKKAKFDLKKLQKQILSTSPYFAAPDSMIWYETWTNTGYGFTLTSDSELYRYDNDPIKAMLDGTLNENDECFTWDCPIPPYALGYKIETSLWMYRRMSQFSNTGAMPILEYFWRKGVYPIPFSYSRERDPPPEEVIVENKLTNLRQPRGPRIHRERCIFLENQEIIPEPKPPDIKEASYEELMAATLKIIEQDLDDYHKSKEYADRKIAGQIIDEEVTEENRNELLDRLLNFDDTARDHVLTTNVDERNDIFEGSDSELGLDLDMW
jgi:hypothetical protein